MKIVALLLTSILFICGIASADPGELDEKGGHYNQQTGEYHYHRQITPEEKGLSIHSQAITNAQTDAAADAQRDSTWYGAGFFFSILGIGAAYIMTPPVPAERLLGKSPEYIVFYTTEYQKAIQQKHVEQASIGCLLQAAAVGLYYYFRSQRL